LVVSLVLRVQAAKRTAASVILTEVFVPS